MSRAALYKQFVDAMASPRQHQRLSNGATLREIVDRENAEAVLTKIAGLAADDADLPREAMVGKVIHHALMASGVPEARTGVTPVRFRPRQDSRGKSARAARALAMAGDDGDDGDGSKSSESSSSSSFAGQSDADTSNSDADTVNVFGGPSSDDESENDSETSSGAGGDDLAVKDPEGDVGGVASGSEGVRTDSEDGDDLVAAGVRSAVKAATAALQAKLDRALRANSELTAQFVSQAKQLDQARRKEKGAKRSAGDDGGQPRVDATAPRAKTTAKRAAPVPTAVVQGMAAEGVKAGPMDRFVRVEAGGDGQEGGDGPEVIDMVSEDGMVVPPRRAKKTKHGQDLAIGARVPAAAAEEANEAIGGGEDVTGAPETVSKAKVSGVGCFSMFIMVDSEFSGAFRLGWASGPRFPSGCDLPDGIVLTRFGQGVVRCLVRFWCDFGAVRCSMVLNGAVWCGAVRCGAMRCGVFFCILHTMADGVGPVKGVFSAGPARMLLVL
jgi:hypothetical protein